MTRGAAATAVILIVDDNPANVRLLDAVLRTEGFQVIAASEGTEAIDRLDAGGIDLVLLDVMMPGMDGFEVCRTIKGDDETRHIPVILLTALTAVGDKVTGQAAGADDFVSKPFDRIELLLRVRAGLRIKAMHDDLQERIGQLEATRRELRRLADTDGLTGLRNRRYLASALEVELDRSGRYGRPLSVVVIDLDWFKSYNDRFGHRAGDELLRVAAGLLVDEMRTADVAARWGGEEFLLVLPETGATAAASVAERLRGRLAAETAIDGRPGVTASFGVATFPGDGRAVAALIDAADRRLYRAKQSGRDRVVDADDRGRGTAGASRGGLSGA